MLPGLESSIIRKSAVSALITFLEWASFFHFDNKVGFWVVRYVWKITTFCEVG